MDWNRSVSVFLVIGGLVSLVHAILKSAIVKVGSTFSYADAAWFRKCSGGIGFFHNLCPATGLCGVRRLTIGDNSRHCRNSSANDGDTESDRTTSGSNLILQIQISQLPSHDYRGRCFHRQSRH